MKNNNPLGSTACAACKQYVPANEVSVPVVMCGKCQSMSERELIDMMRKQSTNWKLSTTEQLALAYLVKHREWHVDCGWMCDSYRITQDAYARLAALEYAERVPLAAPIQGRPEIRFRYRPTDAGREARERLRRA